MPVHFLPSVYGGIYVQQCMDTLLFSHHVCLIQVTTAPGFHLFPFRTEKLSPVTPMVLRNSGRVGSRRFQREAPVSEDAGAFLFSGYFVCLALYLPCFACFALFCFACFLGVSRFLVGIILILVKYFSFFAFRILYRITSYPYHIIYLASISSYILLFLSLKVTLLCA